MGGFEDGFDEKYKTIIEGSAEAVRLTVKNPQDENDPRVIQLAAANAYYAIMCTADYSDGITSFSAGDVSISEARDTADGALRLLNAAKEACRSLIHNDGYGGFAFLSV